jgi:GNAT superfamily N-acetyltransferase
MGPSDVDWMAQGYGKMGWTKPDGYFQEIYRQQGSEELVVLVAQVGDQYVGHLKIVWHPSYPGFRENGIPEVQDLNVLPQFRRNRIATQLMDRAEEIVSKKSALVGIGVGLHPGYNAAQKMYVLRGHVPDAQGVTYDDQYVEQGARVRLDDRLILHLVKELG